MKTAYRIITMWLLTVILFPAAVDAQRGRPPESVAGRDLEGVKKLYDRAIRRGNVAYTLQYADALFVAGSYSEAADRYAEADALNLITTDHHKRNYVHAALHTGKRTPYARNTGYFSKEWQPEVNISPFCSNTPNEDFAPFYWNGVLFVTSSGSRDTNQSRYRFTDKPFLNLRAFVHDCIDTELPSFLPANINTMVHDGPVAISDDGSLLVITRNHNTLSSEGIYNLYMVYYVKKDNRWAEGAVFPLSDPEFSVQHPYFSDRDSSLYFTSNVPGGLGGFDLYKSSWDGQSWGQPVNLGEEVNSPYDEVFPSFTPGGDLVYATNHIETTGGLDLVLFRDGVRYLFPPPFNTINDDFSITYRDKTTGYFSSNRDRVGFDDDIYVFEMRDALLPGEEPEEVIAETVPAVTLRVTPDRWMDEEPPGLVEETLAAGYFEVFFDNDHPNPHSTAITTMLSYQQTYHAYMLRRDAYNMSSVNSRAEIDDFFAVVEKGMAQLRWFMPFLAGELQKGQSYTILFTSHTSPLAPADYNMNLSKRRFASVENYMTSWNGGALAPYIMRGLLSYENHPMGSLQSRPSISADRNDPGRSVYGVDAARERRVTFSWRRNGTGETTHTQQAPRDQPTAGPAPATVTAPAAVTAPATGQVFYLIVGSFQRSQSAETHAADLGRKYNASAVVLPQSPNGLYRVSFGTYNSEREAVAAMRNIRRDIPDAWILRP